MLLDKISLLHWRHSLFKHLHQFAEALPKTTRKLFLPNANKKEPAKPPLPPPPSSEIKRGPRLNAFNIQMLSRKIYDQIFPQTSSVKVDPILLQHCKTTLQKHNMMKTNEDYLPEVDFKLPPLLGTDIEEHFKIIGEQQVKPYGDLIQKLLTETPPRPKTWLMQPGWTRYAPNSEPETVSYPMEEALVFDIEVCMSAGKTPTLATAVSDQAWYGWVSQSLIDGTSKPVTSHQHSTDSLIPLESGKKENGLRLNNHLKKAKIVVGHNVSFDRARIKEQYWLQQTGTRFLDTMSLHICISGLTSYQRAVLKSSKESEEDEDWKSCSSLNSLDEVHKLYCKKSLSKVTRDLFVEGGLIEIRDRFQEAMSYCSEDVVATQDVLRKLIPLFYERFPHPVTMAGMLELSVAYLPVNSNWDRYIANCEQTYEDLEIESRMLLARRADQACQLLHDDKYKEDLWMWDQDWEVKNLGVKKSAVKRKQVVEDKEEEDEEMDRLEKKFRYLEKTKGLLTNTKTLLPGYPNWYRKLCTKPTSSPDWVPGPHLISTSMRITPKLLSLTWEGYPLLYLTGKGWGFLIPFTDDVSTVTKLPLIQLVQKCPLLLNKPPEGSSDVDIRKLVQENLVRKEYYSKLKKDNTDGLYKGSGVWCDTEVEDCCFFFKLPHKNGPGNNVGNPLAKDFLNKFSENVLAGDTESAELVLSIARMMSYWRNNRDRILNQMVVWLGANSLPKSLREQGGQFGAIVPQVVVCGTLTRRAVEPTWMTASNTRQDRVGSELRAMVQAPDGYSIVGADVDSQELWIASVIGDAHMAKTHGATPMGWMTLSGTKADGTDMHSLTAKAVGISRDHAKVINYARIYGAGQNFAERLLKQFNPSISESEARQKASKMFALTKGKRVYRLKREHLLDFPDQVYSKWQAFELAKVCGKKVEDMFEKACWVEGTESAMFNRLEAIAGSPQPRTPFLGGALSRALEPKSVAEDKFLPTRVNWVVQSGAVDFLHLMLVCMRWIVKDKARFCISFHDEVRYLVSDRYKYQAALAMHVTNLLTRAFCVRRLGMEDLPQSVAFFSSVEVDKVLRKDAKLDCKTPSNPQGLEKGFGVANGESLDVWEAVEKAAGRYSAWYEQFQK